MFFFLPTLLFGGFVPFSCNVFLRDFDRPHGVKFRHIPSQCLIPPAIWRDFRDDAHSKTIRRFFWGRGDEKSAYDAHSDHDSCCIDVGFLKTLTQCWFKILNLFFLLNYEYFTWRYIDTCVTSERFTCHVVDIYPKANVDKAMASLVFLKKKLLDD